MEKSSYNLEDYYYYEYDYIRMTTSFQIVSAILISILILFAISGNTITIIAYITDKRLHTVYDFFIFNLAITDLLIGCISMPFYAIYTLQEFVWKFGDTFCKVWNVIDFTLCLESIILILMLSFDRLCLVKYGPFYSAKVTNLRAKCLVILSWIISFLLYGPAIIGWNYWVGYTTVEPLDCDVEFAYNFVFTTTAAVVEFVIPVVCLGILNVMIYKHIKSRIDISTKISPKQISSSTISKEHNFMSESHNRSQVDVDKISAPENKQNSHVTKNGRHLQITEVPKIVVNELDVKQDNADIKENNSNSINGRTGADIQNIADNSSVTFTSGRSQNRISFMATPHRSSFLGTLERNLRRKSKNKNEHSRVKRDSKAARFLAILVIVFLACWAPYTITTIIVSFCGDDCINTSVYESMNWLLWSKSAINPLLYAINSTRYRYHFKRYIFFCKNQVYPSETETTCQTAG